MIVKMSKVKIFGPKNNLEPVLFLLQESGIFHIEYRSLKETFDERYIRSFIPDEKTLGERLFLETLNSKIEELFSYLPSIPVRKSYIEPKTILDTISKNIERHIKYCRELSKEKERLKIELSEINKYRAFVEAMEGFLKDIKSTPDLNFIGCIIKKKSAIEDIKRMISDATDGKFEFLTKEASDGSLVGLIIVENKLSEKLDFILKEKEILEFQIPATSEDLNFLEKIYELKNRIFNLSKKIEEIEEKLKGFTIQWAPIYKRVKEWIEERLSIMNALTYLFETKMCFFLFGWIPSEAVPTIKQKLTEKFEGSVILEEEEIHEEDIDKVPIIIKNPAYFQPFELFTRLLPLPSYTSYDPTPFIAIFFPLFFGMILGDAGYGLVLLLFALFLKKRYKEKRNIHDASRILFISSIYTIFFGILYGEFFGELPKILFNIEPICVERRSAIIPVFIFAISVGVIHVIIGIILGFMSAIKRQKKSEALYRLLSILLLLCIIALVIASFGIAPSLLTKPIIIVILILAPLLFFTGGILAPFELIKSIGHIISYARIMAIGLTSVLLAFVANTLAGIMGNIVLGIIVAGLLHLLNIILGVFSPTIHSLRLHYVEFFTKFITSGGKKFEPLKK